MTCALSLIAFVAFSSAQDSVPRRRSPEVPSEPVFESGISSDEVPGVPYSRVNVRNSNVMRRKSVIRSVVEDVWEEIPAEELKQTQDFLKATQTLRAPKDDVVRKSAESEIHEILVNIYDQDTTKREKELASIEERVTLLRSQLEKRKTSKQEIISLRLKTIIYRADGLEFPENAPMTPDPEPDFETGAGSGLVPSLPFVPNDFPPPRPRSF